MNKTLIIILTIILFNSCGSKRVIVNSDISDNVENKLIESTPNSDIFIKVQTPIIKSVEDYINYFSQVAIDEMKSYKIPASITLAQGILESGSGRGRLAVEANNHFGIKCHGWTGAKIFHDDDLKQECFRKYSAPEFSYRDHSIFLSSRDRYSKLFKLEIDDYKGWAKGLKNAGYATDKKYPDKLISLIERYNLSRYDEIVTKTKRKKLIKFHTVIKGETLYSISKKYKIKLKRLINLNNFKNSNIKTGQKIIISN